ncbi:MAG: riboflavin synthase [Aeromonadales bacterium]|nr:riboflavin synthase [Aeromonadales bacterium]
MFTGIVQTVGTLKALKKRGNGYEILMQAPSLFAQKGNVALGDSIAHNGVCLTVTKIMDDCYTAEISAETVKCTCFKQYKVGQKINLELACTLDTHLGGHIMQGHVDGVGKVISKKVLDDAYDIWVRVSDDISRYIATKGSIAVNGVSLTVNEIKDDTFRLTLIPHTQSSINFDDFNEGCEVNIEVDVLSRYLERLLLQREDNKPKKSGLTMNTLLKNGFI